MVCDGKNAKTVCETLNISRSGYYDFKDRKPSKRRLANEILDERIKAIHEESRGTYGLPRIRAQLKKEGLSCGKSRVCKAMKRLGISVRKKAQFKAQTTDSNHAMPIADRLFKTEDATTHPTRPGEVWAGDISYIHTGEGFLYLATWMDVFTRKIVGYAMSDSMKAELIISAFDMARINHDVAPDTLTIHSDRGTQYACEEWRETLAPYGIKSSMSRRGNCYDNAYAESFFATLKKEEVYRKEYKTRQEARAAIFEYIEVWYNRKRLHSSLSYRSPMEFEAAFI
jgi:putative transposase